MAGTYMGQAFPISGVAVIGREPTNPVPPVISTFTGFSPIAAGSLRVQVPIHVGVIPADDAVQIAYLEGPNPVLWSPKPCRTVNLVD